MLVEREAYLRGERSVTGGAADYKTDGAGEGAGWLAQLACRECVRPSKTGSSFKPGECQVDTARQTDCTGQLYLCLEGGQLYVGEANKALYKARCFHLSTV